MRGAPPETHDRVGRYDLRGSLGRGEFGEVRRAVAADGGADGPRGQRRDALTPSAAPRSVPFENEPPLPSSDAGTSAEPRDDDDAPPAAAAAAEGSAARGGGDEGDHVDDHDRAPAAALAIKSIAWTEDDMPEVIPPGGRRKNGPTAVK